MEFKVDDRVVCVYDEPAVVGRVVAPYDRGYFVNWPRGRCWHHASELEHAPDERPTLKVELVHPNARLPEYKTDGSAGMDLYCPEKGYAPVGAVTLIRLGIKVAIPDGYEGQIRLRSSVGGLGVVIPNAPGTIDSDYRGELVIQVLPLVETLLWAAGDRLCQLVIAPVARCAVVAGTLDVTDRGEGGFGSTGR